jgi:hypothetical protein
MVTDDDMARPAGSYSLVAVTYASVPTERVAVATRPMPSFDVS